MIEHKLILELYTGLCYYLIHIYMLSENQEMVQDFRISHYPADNILPLYTYCEDIPCLIFQYMENGSLYQKLQDAKRPLTWKQRANIATGIARGLYHLHANNVVHCRINSRKVLLDKYLEPKITGSSTNRLLYNESGVIVNHINVPSMNGTPYYLPNWYIAHQQGKIVRKQIDVYSFGIVLLEIMSGMVPAYKSKDPCHKTLRDFVNNDILNHCEPESEYVAPDDEDKRHFNITTMSYANGAQETVTRDADWAKIMFDIGRQCTVYDQTPWRAPFKDPEPWKTMQEHNITMEKIYQTLEACYEWYQIHLGLQFQEANT